MFVCNNNKKYLSLQKDYFDFYIFTLEAMDKLKEKVLIIFNLDNIIKNKFTFHIPCKVMQKCNVK